MQIYLGNAPYSSKFKNTDIIVSHFQCTVPHYSDPHIGKCQGEKKATSSGWDLASNHTRTAWWPLFNRRKIPSCCCCSVAQACPTLHDPRDCSTPGLPVPHHLPEIAQDHVHWNSDAIQLSHPLSPSSSSAFNLSQFQGLFQWVSSLHQMSKVLELHIQHQCFQRVFRVDFL